MPDVGAEGLDVFPLTFRMQNIEKESRFACAAQSGEYNQISRRKIEVDSLEVIMSGSADQNTWWAFVHAYWSTEQKGNGKLPGRILASRRGFEPLLPG